MTDDFVYLESFKTKIEEEAASTEKVATTEDTNPKPELNFKIPHWFLESNVFTAGELWKLEKRIVLVKAGEEKGSNDTRDAEKSPEKDEDAATESVTKESAADAEKKTEPQHSASESDSQGDEERSDKASSETKDEEKNKPLRIAEDRIEELRDIVLDSIRLEDGKLPENQPSVLICAKSDQFPDTTNAVISHLAAEMEATLIKIDVEDLQDLALDFDIQETAHEKEHGKKAGEKAEDTAVEKTAECAADAPKGDAAVFSQLLPPLVDPRPVLPSTETRNYDDACGVCGLAAFYFGVKKPSHASAGATERCKRAMAAVFGSLDRKKAEVSTNASKDGEQKNKVKDVEKTVVDEEKSVEKKPERKNEEAKEHSHTLPGVTFIHLSDWNGIDNCLDARRYITRLREEVDKRRKDKEKIILFISVRSDRSPFQFANGHTSAGTALWHDANCSELVEKRMKCSAASTFDISSLLNKPADFKKNDPFGFDFSWILNSSGTQRTDGEHRAHNVRWIKRVLRYNVRAISEIEVLKPAFSWDNELTEKTLKYLDESSWTHADYQRVLRQVRHRVTKEADLPLADIVAVLERMQRNAAVPDNEKDDEGKDSEFKKKLEKIKKDCNSFEEELISSVIDPDTIKNGYDEVIIDEETKANVQQLVSLFKIKTDRASEHLIQPLRMTGCMFFGPPGTGKTHLARAIAKDSGSAMLAAHSATMTSNRVGETAEYIQAAFSLAAKLHPCVIFIDEVDALFYRCSSCDKSWQRSALTQFLQEMDSLAMSEKRPLVVVATNRPSDLDEAFMRRLPHKVSFALPNQQQRVKILNTFLKEGDLDEEISVENLAEQAVNMSGSDLRTLCSQAVLAWATEQVKVVEWDKKEGEKKEGGEPKAAKVLLKAHHFAKAFTMT